MVAIKIDTSGYAVMDEVIALIDSLPKVQQSITCQHLLEKVGIDIQPGGENARTLANWLYDPTK